MKTRLEIAAGEIVEHKGDLTITGNIGEGAKVIITDGSLIVKGDVLKNANIKLNSQQNNIGGVIIRNGNITVTGGVYCSISNSLGGTYINGVRVNGNNFGSTKEYTVTVLGSVGDNVSITANDDISIAKNIGANCNIKSNHGGLKAYDIGAGTEVNTYGQITVHDVKSSCQIKSSMHGLTANNIADKVVVNTYEDITARNVYDNAKLTSSMHGITVNDTTGSGVKMKSYETIYLNKVGNDCEIHSSMHGIEISGNTGNNVDIKGYDDIRTKDLGSHANVKSSMHTVTVGNLGPSANINAYGNIDVNGVCPSNAKIKSSMGKVRKNGPVKDMSYYAAPKLEEKVQTSAIPEHFLCPISKKMMTSPVMFTNDGETYDEVSLRQKLANMGFDEDEIKKSIVPNRVMINMISAFLQNHPEHISVAKMGR